MNIRCRLQSGYSLIELIVVMGLISTLLGIGAAQFHKMAGAKENAAAIFTLKVKKTRMDAIATTSAMELYAIDNLTIGVRRGQNCSDSVKTEMPTSSLILPPLSKMLTTGWSLCFNSRGYSDMTVPLEIDIRDSEGQSRKVGVYAGGGTYLIANPT
jgi:prepilin-type N-terminal cleavage/methylation domain-containing protein